MTTSARESPMFPLGTVLHPFGAIPLQVFEPRYRVMMHDVMAADRRFGVTMIERGSEVGGGDQRAVVGTMAEIARAEESPDGRWAVLAVGQHRIRVIEWLADDPYPRALVEPWPYDDAGADHSVRLGAAATRVRQALALLSELGASVRPAVLDLPDEQSAAMDLVAAAAPLGAFDRYQVLASPTRRDQLDRLVVLLDDQLELMRASLD